MVYRIGEPVSDRLDSAESATLRALAARFRDAREQQGLSQESLARLSGVHRVTVARFEAGDLDLRFTTLAKLATALGVSLDDAT